MAKQETGIKEGLKDIKELKLDLITFEVLRNAFVSACYEGSTNIEQFAYHPVVGMGRDRSNGILTVDGGLVAHGHTDAAAHYGSFEDSLINLFKHIPKEKMKPGDAYMFSDPYEVGSHVNDTHLFKPIFSKDELVAFSCTVVHWPDMGGPLPGTFNPRATSCYAEGLRIPPIKLFANNELNEELFTFWAYNIRGAVERRGDLTAQFGAASLLEKRIQDLCAKYGNDTVKLSFEEQFNYTERLLFRELDEIDDGEWEFDDYGDKDVMAPGEPPIRVHCKLTKKGRNLTFDWSGSDPAPVGSWGGPRGTCLGANYLGFMIGFPHLFPLNHGITRNLNIETKPGTCVHVVFPSPTTGYCSGAFDKVESVTIALMSSMLAKTRPWRVYPGSVSLTNLCTGGYNPRTRKDFVQYTFSVGGENARTFRDGKDLIFMRFANAKTIPQELEERWFPILYTRYEAVPDWCGHGKFRGGFPLVREIDILSDGTMTIHGDREIYTPYGIAGGTNGGGGQLIVNPGTDKEQNVGMYATGIEIKKGDHLWFSQSGGGGIGDPRERDPELVIKDVMDGWLSVEAAKEFYGVVIKVGDEEALEYEVDEKATEELRKELKKTPIPEGRQAHQVHPVGKNIKPGWWPTFEEVQPHITVSRPPGW
jgi:N-methylhydantoinase B